MNVELVVVTVNYLVFIANKPTMKSCGKYLLYISINLS